MRFFYIREGDHPRYLDSDIDDYTFRTSRQSYQHLHAQLETPHGLTQGCYRRHFIRMTSILSGRGHLNLFQSIRLYGQNGPRVLPPGLAKRLFIALRDSILHGTAMTCLAVFQEWEAHQNHYVRMLAADLSQGAHWRRH